MEDIFIGLGSNLGNRKEMIEQAIRLIKENPQVTISKISSLIETKPQGGPAQPDYLNAVIKIQTEISPHNLLKFLQIIENKLGRVREIKNGPRTIDLDILLYGKQKINDTDLIIPHPRMQERDFVLKPLLEIAPNIQFNEASPKASP